MTTLRGQKKQVALLLLNKNVLPLKTEIKNVKAFFFNRQ